MQGYYAGFDIGLTFHVLVVVDGVGKRVLKRRVANTFNCVLEAINRVQSMASGSEVFWAVEMVDNNARMLVETLVGQGKKVYQTTPFRLKRFKEAGAQPRKSDAIDATALANFPRLRRDELTPINDAIASIAMYDARLAEKGRLIEKALAGCDVARRLMLLPGISRVVAATIIGEAGNISRFANEGKFATYCGLTPICKQSGISRGSHRLARQTNKRLLNVMYLSAISSIKSFSLSKAYLERRLAASAGGCAGTHVDKIRAIIALARHRCRIIFNILSLDGYVYKPKQADQPSAAGHEDKRRLMATHLRETPDVGRAFQPAKAHDCGLRVCEALQTANETDRWVKTYARETVKCHATALLPQQGSGIPTGEVIATD